MKPFLQGVPFDNGIRMMQRLGRGVTGAAEAPLALFRELKDLKIEKKLLDLTPYQIRITQENFNDPVTIREDNNLTLKAHENISQEMETICRLGFLPISVGGDHSITYPLVKGLCRAFPEKKFGLIYLDAHLDLRPLESHTGVSGLISSGNAFRRIIEEDQISVDGTNMVVIGIHNSNSPLFTDMRQFALESGITVIEDRECTMDSVSSLITSAVRTAGEGTDGVYLSLDIDAVNEADAPGVSAPSKDGLPREVWLKIIEGIANEANLVGVDLVEASSRDKSWTDIINGHETTTSNPDSFLKTLDLLKQTLISILHSKP